MRLKNILLTLCIIFIAGCATPELSLTRQVQEKIESVEVVLSIPQDNLDVTVRQAEGGAGGVLGVLIAAAFDEVRLKRAEKNATPILEASRNYDFRAALSNSMNEKLSRLTKFSIRLPAQLDTVGSNSSKRIAFDHSTASALLFCHVRYWLESGNLNILVQAEIYPKSGELMGFRKTPNDGNPLDEGNAIYRKMFSHSNQAVTPEAIRANLSEGAESIARQLALDLENPL